MKVFWCTDTDWLLSEAAFALYAPCLYRATYEKYRAQIEKYSEDSSVKVYVCEDRGEKVGMLVLAKSGQAARMVGIAVRESRRHQGIGKNMLQRAMDLEDLATLTAQTDDAAIGFYRKCGFADHTEKVVYPDGTVIRYICELKKPANA